MNHHGILWMQKPKRRENTMAKETLNQRRAKLTEKIVKARQDWRNTRNMVEHEVKTKFPHFEWWQQAEMVDNDVRVQVANATLLALCDAANIMGAELF